MFDLANDLCIVVCIIQSVLVYESAKMYIVFFHGNKLQSTAQIMEVMDFLEDEIDEHTYDELIPLQIRMALEDQVFGWDQ